MADFDEVGDLRRRVVALESLIQRIVNDPSLRTKISERGIGLAIDDEIHDRPVGRPPKDRYSTIYRQIRPKAGVELRTWLSVQTLGISTEQVPLPRFFPIRLYADSYDEDQLKELVGALKAFLKAFGAEVTDEFTPEFVSFLQSFIGRFKKSMSSAEAQHRFSKMERAIELQAMGKAQAEIDRTQAESVATLMQACGDADEVSIQAGSIFLEKRRTAEGKIVVRSRILTHSELIEIERRGKLVADGYGGSINHDAEDIKALPQARGENSDSDE